MSSADSGLQHLTTQPNFSTRSLIARLLPWSEATTHPTRPSADETAGASRCWTIVARPPETQRVAETHTGSTGACTLDIGIGLILVDQLAWFET